MNICIPTNEDWGDFEGNLDVAHAYRFFSGRDNKEVQEEFKKNVLMRCFDIGYMPIVPFHYYILGLRDFIFSDIDDCFGKATAADCFIGLIEDKLSVSPEYICPIWNKLVDAVEAIASGQEYFNMDVDIYGDSRDRIKKMLNMVNDNCSAHDLTTG